MARSRELLMATITKDTLLPLGLVVTIVAASVVMSNANKNMTHQMQIGFSDIDHRLKVIEARVNLNNHVPCHKMREFTRVLAAKNPDIFVPEVTCPRP